MSTDMSGKESTRAMWTAAPNQAKYHASGGMGELIAYVILLAMLVALSTRGWVFDLWFR